MKEYGAFPIVWEQKFLSKIQQYTIEVEATSFVLFNRIHKIYFNCFNPNNACV